MPLLGKSKESERLEQLDTFLESEWTPGPADRMADEAEKGKTLREEMLTRLDNVIANQGFTGGVKAQLRKANLKLTVTEYLLIHVALAVGLGLAGLILFNPALAAIGFIGGFFVPRLYVGQKQKKRLHDFENQLGDVLNLWVNSLRAGYSVQQAMEAVAKEAPAPAGEEFARVVSEMAIGVTLDIAFKIMLSRIESEDLDFVFTAVNIQTSVGGNLAQILDTISETIRERVRIKGEIRTLTASGRATGTLIGLLPILIVLLLLMISPEYMNQLLFGPARGGANIPGLPIPCGWPIVAVGLIMEAIGMAIIRRIVDIEV